MAKQSFWTPERVDEMTRLWRTGFSASQVGQQIGATRNMVIGKVFRLGIGKDQPLVRAPIDRSGEVWTNAETEKLAKLRESGMQLREIAEKIGRSYTSVKKKVADLGIRVKKTAVAVRMTAPLPPPTPEALVRPEQVYSLFDVGVLTCRYPFGDPKDEDFGFCGYAARMGSSYCDNHHAVCYQHNGFREKWDSHISKQARRAA